MALLIEAQARHLRDDRERLARIESWRAAMTSTLAHDVQTPLATVQLVLEQLRDRASGSTELMLASAQRQTARIARLSEGLLDLDRIDSDGQLKLDRQLHPARRLVQDSLSYVRTAGLAVEIHDKLMICVDRQRFEQIVVNPGRQRGQVRCGRRGPRALIGHAGDLSRTAPRGLAGTAGGSGGESANQLPDFAQRARSMAISSPVAPSD